MFKFIYMYTYTYLHMNIYTHLHIQATDQSLLQRRAKILAIEDELGVFRDGTTVPLTLRQSLLFGTCDARFFFFFFLNSTAQKFAQKVRLQQS
jgi:hypothetical protein